MSAPAAGAARPTVALETSSARPSVAARLAGRLLERPLAGERAHASDLLPALERTLGDLGVAPRDVGAVIVGTGPGSYTGLRVGVATALGLARGCAAELFGLSSLEALAWGELVPGASAAFLLDARQGQLYLARYRRRDDALETLLAPCVTTAERLPALLDPSERVFADPAAQRAARLLEARRREPGRFVDDAAPGAGALLELGLLRLAREGPHGPEQVEPLYLRAFAARARRR